MPRATSDLALWWIRRDLRLHDNPALHAALRHAQVLPVFVLDDALWRSAYVGEKRLAFLLGGLHALDADLRARGSRLLIRRGEPLAALTRLVRETGAAAIYAQAEVSPYARQRDARVAQSLPLHLTPGLTALPVEAVHKADGAPYVVYTPYNRRWQAQPQPAADDLLPAPMYIPTPPHPATEPLPATPALPDVVPFPPGEAEARRRLTAFTDGPIAAYDMARDRLDVAGTARLSPYLRFGMLSAQAAVVAARAASTSGQSGAARWLDELIWREFYLTILYHFPQVRAQSFRENLRAIAWDNNRAHFAAWQAGLTGYPVVDAGMRQLATTGWMHNRARMLVAAFLTKDLLIDWRWGERYFMQHLLDGDPASNNGGWQWAAGTGTDAAPYFRIFNPTRQGEKYDPAGDYVRRWIPELGTVPTRYIHAPERMPRALQEQVGCVIGRDYPAPIIIHAEARERTLAAYRAAQK